MKTAGLTLKLALLAAVCYLAYHWLGPEDQQVIEVTRARIDAVVSRQESLLGRPLRDAERAAAERAYVDEEILVREALRRGVDRADSQVRRLVVAHAWRELLRMSGYEPPVPTRAELRAYYDAHARTYVVPERLDLRHVGYAVGNAPADPDAVVTALENGADFQNLGDAGAEMIEVTRSRIALSLGLELANEVFSLPRGTWHGPLISSEGTHFFRVERRRPARQASFSDVERDVERDFLEDAETAAVDGALRGIRRRYVVDIAHD